MRHRTRTAVPDHHDKNTWLRRGEVAKLLGVKRESVRGLENTGALHPITDKFGEYRFDPDEVHAYVILHPPQGRPYISDGELAAQAFALFAAGHGRREVVLVLRITPTHADELFIEWQQDDFIAAIAAKKLEQELEDNDKKRAERRANVLALLQGSGK